MIPRYNDTKNNVGDGCANLGCNYYRNKGVKATARFLDTRYKRWVCTTCATSINTYSLTRILGTKACVSSDEALFMSLSGSN